MQGRGARLSDVRGAGKNATASEKGNDRDEHGRQAAPRPGGCLGFVIRRGASQSRGGGVRSKRRGGLQILRGARAEGSAAGVLR